MSSSNNKNMKWVHVTYERNVRHINKGKFLTSHDPEMVERWLETTNKNVIDQRGMGDDFEFYQKNDPDEVEGYIESISQSEDWEVVGHNYRVGEPEFVVDESYSGKGDLDDAIQEWIDTKRVDITSIYATGHNPLEIQDFIEEYQKIFNKIWKRKTIFDLKDGRNGTDNEVNLFFSLRKLVGLEVPKGIGTGFHTEWVNGKGHDAYLQLKEEDWVRSNWMDDVNYNKWLEENLTKEEYKKWKDKKEDEEVEETCEVSSNCGKQTSKDREFVSCKINDGTV